ncbi:MAG: Crp/Fnr family transcriptional regulator [Alphaproteobacteria bacterium]
MTDTREYNTLRGINLFQKLADDVIEGLNRRCTWRRYRTNEQIIDRQDNSRDVYFVSRGTVRIVNYSLSGREVTFDDVQEGEVFGELAALDGAPRSANVVALTEVVVGMMSPELFRRTLLEQPDIPLLLMTRLAYIIRASTGRIMDLSTLGANNRVYAELLRLAKPNFKDNTAVIDPIPIHGDIASRVSTTRETVARVLSDLNRKSIVLRRDNSLYIPDIVRLTDMVEQFRGE